MGLAKFIVFEGIDGSGTTTQAKKLADYLMKKGEKIFHTKLPSESETGLQIRRILQGKETVTNKELSTLFKIDSDQHSEVMHGFIASGGTVICDRYLFSAFAYRLGDDSVGDVYNLYANHITPDITFFLKLSPSEAIERIQKRSQKAEMFETEKELEVIAGRYHEGFDIWKKHDPNFNLVELNASKSIRQIGLEVLQRIEK